MSPEDEAALKEAVAALERTTFAGRLTEMVGRQIDFAGKLIPQPVAGAVGKAVTLALKAAFRVAVTGLSKGANAKGVIKRTLKMKKKGILVFTPLTSPSCGAQRIGVRGVFTPPVTG